ncbi:aldo/keto reductase [Calditrichota bacterium]
MINDFLNKTLGRTGFNVHRLALSATYRPGKKAIYKAIDSGINLFLSSFVDTQMSPVVRDLIKSRREEYFIMDGGHALIFGFPGMRRTLESSLRRLKTDYLDIFLFGGCMKAKWFTPRIQDEMISLREEGKVRAIGISTHDRKFAGKLAEDGVLDVLMIRYNAAHRGAEEDIFPHLAVHNPGVINFTATRWGSLLKRPKNWAAKRPVPSAGDCYRFALSNPNVDVCFTAPTNLKQIEQNLAEIENGQLDEDKMEYMKEFGDAVYGDKRIFYPQG